jgi:acyl-CoA synthetase (AMP-forming)/AMP-acid ligase II
MTTWQRLRVAAAACPEKIAVSNEVLALSFADLVRRAEQFGAWLARGAPRPLVLIALPGGPEFTAVQLGALAAGAIAAPVPERTTTHEARAYLRLLRPDVAVVGSLAAARGLLAALPATTELVSVADPAGAAIPPYRVVSWDGLVREAGPQAAARELPSTTCLIQFTSGSTGLPKGVLISDANLLANLDQNAAHLAGFAGRATFCPVPQFHAMGNAVVLEHLAAGASLHLSNRFVPADDLRRMQRHRCFALACSPNYVKLLLKLGLLERRRLPDLASFTLGAADVEPELVGELRARFPDATVHVRYGLSESVGALCRLDLEPGAPPPEPGLVGPPVAGAELAPLPTLGTAAVEVRARSASNAAAVLEESGVAPLLAEGGWLATGDLGVVDAQGRLHLRGRRAAFLKSAGHRVHPFEIEALLRANPAVQEAVVVGVPDPLLGERIVACLEPAPSSAIVEAELRALCAANLAGYKLPHHYVVLDPLPRTPAGKPDRRAIQERAIQLHKPA